MKDTVDNTRSLPCNRDIVISFLKMFIRECNRYGVDEELIRQTIRYIHLHMNEYNKGL